MTYVPTRFYGPAFISQRISEPIKTFATAGIIKSIIIANTTNGVMEYELYLAPAGTDAQDSNKIIPKRVLDSLSVNEFSFSLVVNPGDSLYTSASVPNSITATISGVAIV